MTGRDGIVNCGRDPKEKAGRETGLLFQVSVNR